MGRPASSAEFCLYISCSWSTDATLSAGNCAAAAAGCTCSGVRAGSGGAAAALASSAGVAPGLPAAVAAVLSVVEVVGRVGPAVDMTRSMTLVTISSIRLFSDSPSVPAPAGAALTTPAPGRTPTVAG